MLKVIFGDRISGVPRMEFRLTTLEQIGRQDQISIQVSTADSGIQAGLHFCEGSAVEIDSLERIVSLHHAGRLLCAIPCSGGTRLRYGGRRLFWLWPFFVVANFTGDALIDVAGLVDDRNARGFAGLQT